jgi:hypothetical protein
VVVVMMVVMAVSRWDDYDPGRVSAILAVMVMVMVILGQLDVFIS